MKRMLLIDGSPSYRESWGSFFSERGFGVAVAGTSEEGYVRWRESGPFDLIVVDLHLPGQDGVAVVETFSEMTRAPVVAVAERLPNRIDLLPAAAVLGATRSYRKPIATEFFWQELCALVGIGGKPATVPSPGAVLPSEMTLQ